MTVCILETLIPVWGMIGIWTDKFGLDQTSSVFLASSDDVYNLQVSQ
jgi:hypothetical protein